jgi:lysylphosphatidylglycerol synthetase-like protein (DUF2156 family)
MNLQALLDGLLAVTALYVAKQAAPTAPALRLSGCLLGIAATLGALRFSGLLPLPPLHQFFSMLGAGVGLPLLAIAVTQSTSAVAAQRRFTWIFAVIVAVVCTLVVMVAQLKAWASISAVVAALAILTHGIFRKRFVIAMTGLLMLTTLIAFAAKAQLGPLQSGDLLHIGLALTLLLASRFEVDGANAPRSIRS